MSIRSSLTLLLILGLLGLLWFQNSLASAGQAGSIVTSIKLKRIQLVALTVGSDGQTTKCTYRLGEFPQVRLSLMNQTVQEIPLREVHDRISQYQFDLRRDGALVEPRPEITKRLKREETGEEGWGSVTVLDPVKPYQTATIALLKLDAWYDQLAGGPYRLTVKYRIANSKEMEVAASTDFYVVR